MCPAEDEQKTDPHDEQRNRLTAIDRRPFIEEGTKDTKLMGAEEQDSVSSGLASAAPVEQCVAVDPRIRADEIRSSARLQARVRKLCDLAPFTLVTAGCQ